MKTQSVTLLRKVAFVCVPKFFREVTERRRQAALERQEYDRIQAEMANFPALYAVNMRKLEERTRGDAWDVASKKYWREVGEPMKKQDFIDEEKEAPK